MFSDCEWTLYTQRNWSIRARTLDTKLRLMDKHWKQFFKNYTDFIKWHDKETEEFVKERNKI